MNPNPTPRRIPVLAVLSIHDLRRLFRQARTTGKVKLPSPEPVQRAPERGKAA